MDFDTAMLLALPASFLAFLGFEALFPSGRDMPQIRHWRLIGLAGLALTLMVYVFVPLLVVPYLPPMAIVDLQGWGNWAALPVWALYIAATKPRLDTPRGGQTAIGSVARPSPAATFCRYATKE